MSLKNTAAGFGTVSRTLHWGIFLLMAVMVWLGLDFTSMPRGDERTAVAALHKSIGLVVLTLMVIRLIWRWRNDKPDDPSGTPRWRSLTTMGVHYSLYVLAFAQMSSGILTTLHAGRDISFFGLFSIAGFERNHDLHEIYEEIHVWGWKILAIIVGIHVLASLYHQFILKDGVLRRMIVGNP